MMTRSSYSTRLIVNSERSGFVIMEVVSGDTDWRTRMYIFCQWSVAFRVWVWLAFKFCFPFNNNFSFFAFDICFLHRSYIQKSRFSRNLRRGVLETALIKDCLTSGFSTWESQDTLPSRTVGVDVQVCLIRKFPYKACDRIIIGSNKFYAADAAINLRRSV